MAATNPSLDDANNVIRMSFSRYAQMILNNFYPQLAKKQKRIVLFQCQGETSDAIEVTSYLNVASMKMGDSVVVDKIISENMIPENPLLKQSTLIFVLQVGCGWAFAISPNVPQKKLSKALPLKKIWFVMPKKTAQ